MEAGRSTGLQNWTVVLLTVLVITILIFAFWLWRCWKDGQRAEFEPEEVELEVLQCPAGHKLQDAVSVYTERRWCDYCDEIRLHEDSRVFACVECKWIICPDCYHRRNRPSSRPSPVLFIKSPGSNPKLHFSAKWMAPSPSPPATRMDLRSRIQRLTGLGPGPNSERKPVSRAERIGKEIDHIKVVLTELTNVQRHYRDGKQRRYDRSTSLSSSSSSSRTPPRKRSRYERRMRRSEERRYTYE